MSEPTDEVWTQEQPEDMLLVERVRGFVAARTGMRGLDPDVVMGVAVDPESDDPVRNLTLSDLRALLAAVDRLTAERDDARDRAFKAAFAPEVGAEVQWGVQYHEDHTVSRVDSEMNARALTRGIAPDAPRCRVVSPWKPVSP